MNYIIFGNDAEGFIVSHKTKPIKYTRCPCCNKSLSTKFVAETLAQNLEEIDKKLDENLGGSFW